MAKLTTVFLGVLVIAAFNTEFRFIDAGPVPELTVKLLCELLCEHCNGVPNMESGHCYCQVPETHFKDNAACLERVQISAAEMNLKLTHTAPNDILHNRSPTKSSSGAPGRSTPQSTDTHGLPPEHLLPEPENMDRVVNETPELMPQDREGQRRAILVDPILQDDEDQSMEQQHLEKRSVNGNPSSSGEPMYSKMVINEMPPSSLLPESDLSPSKLNGYHAQRDKRSIIKESGSSEVGDFDIKLDTDITIPMFPFGRVSKENSPNNILLQYKVDVQSQNEPTIEAKETKPFVLNKSRSKVEKGYENDIQGNENNIHLNPTTLSPPTVKSQAILGKPNEKLRSKSDDITLKLPPLLPIPTLLPIEQPKSPFQSVLSTNKLLNEPKPLGQLTEPTPLTQLELLSPRSKLLPPLGKSQNKVLNDLIKRGNTNRLTLPVPQPGGMTLLERIQNYQAKLKQRLSEGRSAENILKPLPVSKCLLKLTESGLTPRLNPFFQISPRSYKGKGDCDEDNTNLKESSVDSLQEYRSKLRKSDGGDKNGNVDALISSENRNDLKNKEPLITAVFPDGSPSTLANESRVETENPNGGGETTQFSQPIEKNETDEINSNISSPSIDMSANSNELGTSPRPTKNNPSDSVADQHPGKFQHHQLETTPKVDHLASNESTTGPKEKDFVDSESYKTQTVEPSLTSQDSIPTNSDHPHFLNHNDDSLSPNHFPSVLIQPPLTNIMSPEDRYRAMYDPTAFQNYIQQINNYQALLARNDLADSMRDSFQSVPVAGFVPNPAIHYDHPSRLMPTFNGSPNTHTNHPLNEPSVMMRAYVPGDHPGESYPNNPALQSPPSVFVLRPLPIPGGNIPYPDLLNHLRTGNAIVYVQPIELHDIDK